MLNMIKKVHNTAIVVKSVLKSQEFDEALDTTCKKLKALRNTEKREYEAFYRSITEQKRLMDKYYTSQRKTICKAFFGQLKGIYEQKEQECIQKPFVQAVN